MIAPSEKALSSQMGDAAPRKGGDGVEQGGERPEEKRDAAEKEGVRAAVRGGEGGERRLWAHRIKTKAVGRGVSKRQQGPNIGSGRKEAPAA
ncbi:hypothetical protein Syun_029090 [Stephania yunnanensis]|uniref:Uncharacterized protein n=1 Tax=Stephania yunnanensis TaxID=152371 RepID=A0AAP0E4W3_9MAGN